MPSPATATCTRCNDTGEYHGTRRDGSSYTGACFACQPTAGRRYWNSRPRATAGAYATQAAASLPSPGFPATNLVNPVDPSMNGANGQPAALAPLASPARTRGQSRADANVAAFAVAYPAEYGWLVANAPTINFAASLLSAIGRYVNLTPRQLAAVQRNLPVAAEPDMALANAHIDGLAIGTGMDGQPVTEAQVQAGTPVLLSSLVPARPAYVAPTPRVTIDAAAMRAALLAARTSGLRKPRLTLGLFEFRLGRVGTDRAETVFVYTRHAIRSLNWMFAGSIRADDVWFEPAVRYGNPPMTDEQMALIRDAAINPRNAAAAHGHDTTHCSCCRRLLTDPPSVMAGIGPVCIRRFGWL